MTPPTLPEAPDQVAAYWRNLDDGHLDFARCNVCHHAWLPVSHDCPNCLAADWRFEPASGEAIMLSWVIYNHAYNDLWADRLPYIVALIQLKEGPRLMSNLVGTFDPARLTIDHPVLLTIEDERGTAVPRFTPVGAEPEGGETNE
jgi:uncharacterized protein